MEGDPQPPAHTHPNTQAADSPTGARSYTGAVCTQLKEYSTRLRACRTLPRMRAHTRTSSPLIAQRTALLRATRISARSRAWIPRRASLSSSACGNLARRQPKWSYTRRMCMKGPTRPGRLRRGTGPRTAAAVRITIVPKTRTSMGAVATRMVSIKRTLHCQPCAFVTIAWESSFSPSLSLPLSSLRRSRHLLFCLPRCRDDSDKYFVRGTHVHASQADLQGALAAPEV